MVLLEIQIQNFGDYLLIGWVGQLLVDTLRQGMNLTLATSIVTILDLYGTSLMFSARVKVLNRESDAALTVAH